MTLRISPPGPVLEGQQVELLCEVVAGNPMEVDSVTWYSKGKVFR